MAGPTWDDTTPVETSAAPSWDDTTPVTSGFSWSRAVTDIPKEIAHEASAGAADVAALGRRGEMGAVEGLMSVPKAAMGAVRTVASPVMGAVKSIGGHGLANLEHLAGEYVVNPIAEKVFGVKPENLQHPDPEKMYETAKGDIETALSAARPAGAPIKVGGAYEWQPAKPTASKPSGVVEQPETGEFFESANRRYGNLRGYGVEFDKKAVSQIADNAILELETEGYRDYLAPKVYKTLEELRNVKGQNATVSDLEGVRRTLNKIKDPAERDAASTAVSHIDDYLTKIHGNSPDVVVNPHFADRLAEEAVNARSDWGAAKRGASIDEALERAERQANIHGNIGHQIQMQLRNLRNNRREMKFWTDAEKAELDAAIAGTKASKMAKQAGKYSPHGVVSTIGSVVAGHAVAPGMGEVALPAAGFIAKKISNFLAQGRADRLSNFVKGRSALGRETSINAAAKTALAPRATRPSVASTLAKTALPAPGLPRVYINTADFAGSKAAQAEEEKRRRERAEEPNRSTGGKSHGGAVKRALKSLREYADGGAAEDDNLLSGIMR